MMSFKISRRLWLAGLASASLAALSGTADAQSFGGRHFAPRGQVVSAVPREAVSIRHGNGAYFYRGGDWYRPYGGRFIVVAPPFGAVVPFLPGFYTTFWFGGIPYYYANDAYYLWNADAGGYVVTRPPANLRADNAPPAGSSPTNGQVFIYPKNGQSESQQATDRYECHHWASGQASYDPTQPPPSTATGPAGSGREAYQRALTACLEGRGYSVK
jgi:Family of unknown function (DUF6515)